MAFRLDLGRRVNSGQGVAIFQVPRFVRPSIFRRRQRNALLSIPLIEALLRDEDEERR